MITSQAPALATDSSGKLYAAWTDPARHINIARLVPDGCGAIGMAGRVTLAETTPYGPGLVFDATGRTHMGLMLGWVADDGAHTLNVASWGGATTLTNRGVVSGTGRPTSGPAMWIAQDNVYIMFRGDDPTAGSGFAYFAAAGGCTPVCTFAGNTGVRVASAIGAQAAGPRYGYFNPAGNLVIDGA